MVELALALPEIPPLGYRSFPLKEGHPVQGASSIQITREPRTLHLASQGLEVDINLQTGNLNRIWDQRRSQEWGGEQVGRMVSIEESGNDVSLRIDSSAPVTNETLLGLDLLDSGPLFTRVRIRKQLLRCEVEQVVTLWNQEARLDLETRIFWWGKRNQQVRLGLSGAIRREVMTHGSAFYGTGWTETMEGCGPWNSDEISPENQMSYREVLGWLHLSGSNGGLSICSDHPWYHHAPDGLEAVLMRTCRSCGDSRLYLEQPGEHLFSFTFFPGDLDWKAANVQQLAAQFSRKPVFSLVQTGGTGSLPVSQSFLTVDGENFALSSLYPGQQPGTILARVWETTGHAGKARFSGPLTGRKALAVNFLEEGEETLEGGPGSWALDIPAWGIRTVKFSRDESPD
jgi:alpha-mannosidase